MANALKVALRARPSAEGWRADTLCRQAEAMGFHSFWLPENHFGNRRSIPSPLTLLAAVAARTMCIKPGTTSYLLPIRNPLLAAEEVAVVGQLSNGRVILGVGRGIQASMFKAFAVKARDKRALFQRHLKAMQDAWRGEPILQDEDGKLICLAPLPVQRPHPPIGVAAIGTSINSPAPCSNEPTLELLQCLARIRYDPRCIRFWTEGCAPGSR
jgi:alkanesulfonate monooxygenase SsuD/methylene tetrahydromethanopterin reductase-like flavin-dependent oxidoreductase (luciferase family)